MNFSLILPKTIDNSYQGKNIAKYLFYLLTVITVVRSGIHMLSADGGAQSIATIPLDSYSEQASQSVILIFALWGLSQLIMGIFYVIVALRYKSLIPLMYVFIFMEYTMRVILGYIKPIVTEGTAPGSIGNYIMIPLAIVLFLVSINKNKKQQIK
ncbi:hypothetical protein SAMN03097699_1790 [Flavobacteriaceae bacterium MAR_2010_188]|nr:hypothetical protein SAMN03097699_1790 [Flavobacteriaceae bacterium MAR_2010_188]